MELHYFTLLRQVEFLRSRIVDGKITACYTQQKNEMLLQVEASGGSLWQLQLSADPRYPFILLRPPVKRGKLSTDVLAELRELTISDISVWEGERVIEVGFAGSDLRLLLQLFRNRANFFVVDSHDTILSAFKHHKKYDGQDFQIKKEEREDVQKHTPDSFCSYLKQRAESPLSYVLRRDFLYFTPVIIREIALRLQINPEQPVKNFDREIVLALFQESLAFFSSCLSDEPRVYMSGDYPQVFALTDLHQYSNLKERKFDSVNDALAFFVFRRQKLDRTFQKKEKIEKLLEKKILQLREIIAQLENMPDESDRRAYFQKVGELLLTQIHQIKKVEEQVEVIDYYDPQQRPIKVRLNPQLSIQENAQQYFTKAKEAGSRTAELKSRQKDLKRQLLELQNMMSGLAESTDYKTLSKIEKTLIQMHILQTDAEKMEEVHRPYKQYYFENWEIWVGKNAKDNDEMTFHAAHKDDLWLHAQGTSGSHVVVRNPTRRDQIPKNVIEHAARLAATKSGAKHGSWVPVMVTRIKYVRKPHGSAPGAVIPERTKTVFVEPLR
jgi:predicted ribosome quality control (RQC) complex YloA/Tae2 family protein